MHEYPVREGVAIADGVASLGAFKADAIDLAVFAAHQAAAMRIFDRAGWR